ncbi:MAG: restriction endonuclease subunit S [Flavobacteriia bacterium]|nr:restriction endonuclease subunit S [Flavobacteriia bacterium]
MSELPKGWVEITIGDVAQVKGGKRLPQGSKLSSELTKYPYIRVKDFEKGSVNTLNLMYLEEVTHLAIKNYTISKSDLYISIAGTIGLVGTIPQSLDGANLTENAAKLCELTGVNRNYLKYVLSSSLAKAQFEDKATSSGQPKLALFRIKDCIFPLAPLAEQKRIVEKLDQVLAQVDTIKARLDGIPAILKRFRQSVLAAAVSGKLTEEWRKANFVKPISISQVETEMFDLGLTHGNFGRKLDKAAAVSSEELDVVVKHQDGWPLIRIGSICESVVPNRDKPKTFTGGYHWLLTQNFNEQNIWIDYSKIENGLSYEETKEYKAKIINVGNVIMTCVGRVGLSAVIQEDSVINQQLHAFIVNKFIRAEFLAYCIRANVKYFESKATSTTINYLNKTSCNSLPIPLPSIEEQTEIVRLVDQYFAFADTIEKQVQKAQQRVDKLTQSILAKAFRGELVPQNPDDEPADELLKRIAAARAESEALAKAAKKVGKKK